MVAYNKFASQILHAKIKQKKLVDKSAIAGFINNTDLNRKVATPATKAGLKAKQDKIGKLETCDFNYYLGKIFFGDQSSQNMFVYQPTLNTPELETEKGTDHIGWKSKGVYNSELVTLHGAFLPNIKYLTRRIGMQFNNAPLVVEQHNYQKKL